MSRWVLIAVVYAYSWGCIGCTPRSIEWSTQAAGYGAELQACVATAKTRAESQACRCRVSTAHGRPCDDAGAP